MSYTTIYDTDNQSQVVVIEQLFRQRQIDYRIIDDPEDASVPSGVRVQVRREQVGRAKDILKENGFLGNPRPGPGAQQTKSFWWYLFAGLLVVILVSVLINWYLDAD